MPISYSTVSTQNMELTPMRVSYGPAGSLLDLGGTLGNVVCSVKFGKAAILSDQSGKTVRDRRVNEQMITVTTELAEIQNKDIWKVVFPHAKEVVSGLNKQIYFQAAIGDSDLANAKQLVLHPLSKADADKSGDYLFFKACASAESEITYGPDNQARLKIVWNILPDDSVQPERFMLHGDPTIGVVHASVGAAVPGVGNVGTDSVGSLVVYDGLTKTETISLLCLSGGASAKYQVTGSLSGALGVATDGVSFVSNQISFTITAGLTPAVAGDTFTIATVASNYT